MQTDMNFLSLQSFPSSGFLTAWSNWLLRSNGSSSGPKSFHLQSGKPVTFPNFIETFFLSSNYCEEFIFKIER